MPKLNPEYDKLLDNYDSIEHMCNELGLNYDDVYDYRPPRPLIEVDIGIEDNIVVKTRLVNDPSADCSFLQNMLDYEATNNEFKIELAITPETITNPKRKFLIEAIADKL